MGGYVGSVPGGMDRHQSGPAGRAYGRALGTVRALTVAVALGTLLSGCGMLAQLDVIPTITIEPKDAVMRPGQSWTFTAEIVGEHDLAWHVSHGELVVVGNS